MKNLPFISICIPAYKRVELLERLLQSIASQTYSNFELIVSDDSPDDSVHELCKRFTSSDLRYYRNDPAAGTPENWNLTIAKASGDWIKIMHDDDWFAFPDALEKFAMAAYDSAADFIFSAASTVDETGKIRIERVGEKELNLLRNDPLYLFFENRVGHPSTVLHRKDPVLKYDAAFKWVVDIDFYIRYLFQHPSLHYIDEPLVNIGLGSTQVSESCYKNPDVEIPEYLSLIEKTGGAPIGKNKWVFFCLWNLSKKFRIKNLNEIKGHYHGNLPDALAFIIQYQEKIPTIVLKQTPWSAYFMKKAFHTYSGLNR